MIESKLPHVGTTIFSVMSKLAAEHDAINLSQGFPDFQPPAALTEKIAQALREGRNQYAPMPGLDSLREAISRLVAACYGVTVDPATEVTITSGATEALFAAIQATVRNDDEVIVFDPSYDSYVPAVELAGGTAIRLRLQPNSFALDWDEFAAALSARTRLIIINSPHNPTGALLSRQDLDRLAELLRGRDCFVLSDEVYEHITFDGRGHASVAAHNELYERSFAVSSFGKTFNATGWKIAYVVAPPALTTELRKIHQYLTFATSTPMQHAIAGYLDDALPRIGEIAGFFEQRRDYFAAGLEKTRFSILPCHGTYFQLADYSEISDLGDEAFCRWLTTEHGVAAIPISVFYADPPMNQRVVRFCFAKENDTLDKAFERLEQV
jgi:methionine aminotransferase